MKERLASQFDVLLEEQQGVPSPCVNMLVECGYESMRAQLQHMLVTRQQLMTMPEFHAYMDDDSMTERVRRV